MRSNRFNQLWSVYFSLFWAILLLVPLKGEFFLHESRDGSWQIQLEGEGRVLLYSVDDEGSPGWFFARRDRDWEHSERFTLNADLWLGDSVYGYGKIRYDDGIHPALAKLSRSAQNLRLDELFFAFSPSEDFPTIKLGRFAPAFGNYIGRHNSWDNAFIADPMLYDQVTSVSDSHIPVDAHNLAHYAHQSDNRRTWVSAVWAPYYAEGMALEYTRGPLFYSLAYMNRSVSSRPGVWNDHTFENGSFVGRIEYSDNPEWKFGGSFSMGPYLKDNAVLSPGRNVGDYNEITWSADLTWSKHLWQVWAEAYWARFEVPNAGNADGLYYYVEVKRKINADWYIAGRWNQQIYRDLAGGLDWDTDMWRTELVLGRKIAVNQILKLQWTHIEQAGPAPYPNSLVGMEYVIKF